MANDLTPLSPEQVKQFQVNLKEAIVVADGAIYGTAEQLPSMWEKLKTVFEDSLTFNVFRETRANVQRVYDTSIADWESRKKVLWNIVGTGQYDGKTVNQMQVRGAFKVVQDSITQTRKAISLVMEYARGDVLTSAIGNTFGKLASLLSDAFDTVVGLGKIATKTADWLPWIIGGAIVLPLLLRTFSAYKKGGSTAAAEEAAGQIERGRAAAGRAVASGAKTIVTRGMAGSPRRRRSTRSR